MYEIGTQSRRQWIFRPCATWWYLRREKNLQTVDGYSHQAWKYRWQVSASDSLQAWQRLISCRYDLLECLVNSLVVFNWRQFTRVSLFCYLELISCVFLESFIYREALLDSCTVSCCCCCCLSLRACVTSPAPIHLTLSRISSQIIFVFHFTLMLWRHICELIRLPLSAFLILKHRRFVKLSA